MAEFKIPTEQVTLPSKGLLYPKESPLSKGEIEMRYMTAAHEDILTNANYIRQGTVIDKLLKALIVTDIDYNELLIGDKNAILIAARILGYGKDYEFTYYDKTTEKQGKIDLTLLLTVKITLIIFFTTGSIYLILTKVEFKLENIGSILIEIKDKKIKNGKKD